MSSMPPTDKQLIYFAVLCNEKQLTSKSTRAMAWCDYPTGKWKKAIMLTERSSEQMTILKKSATD